MKGADIYTSLINLGKYGSFHSNQIIGRPYYLTFEILDRTEQQAGRDLRVVKASEVHAETLLEEAEPESIDTETASTPNAGQFDEYGLLATNDKSNVNIIDHPENQKLTYEEIEMLKSTGTSNPKELISKIMANHSQLDQKTAFSLAKYTIRKQKKYMKRFTVLPVDVVNLVTYMMEEKDFTKIMEIRNEILGLMDSWANVHAAPESSDSEHPSCRYLVVDDTGGLIVASIAERMGLLHHVQPTSPQVVESAQAPALDLQDKSEEHETVPSGPQPRRPRYDHALATSNTITVVHANQQPNLALLRYFNFDQTQTPSIHDPSPHPLHTHLQTLTWLQLLEPEADSTYANEPQFRTQEELSTMKPNHRSNYYRKRRRWQRTKQTVDTMRGGEYDGLIIATYMDPVSVLKRLVPLLKGGAQVVVYSAHVEPLTQICDIYSTSRRAAYLQLRHRPQVIGSEAETVVQRADDEEHSLVTDREMYNDVEVLDDARFPLDPTLLLTPAIHRSYARPWQVLPGRTHPLMTGKGGAEGGYVLVSTKVIPLQGIAVQARGKPARSKKRPEQEFSNGDHVISEPSAAQGIQERPESKKARLDGV